MDHPDAGTGGWVMMARWTQAGTVLDRASDSLEEPWPLDELGKLSVGARIRALRTQRGWSTQDLAKQVQRAGGGEVLNRTTIWKLENGRRRLQAEEAAVFARALEVPVEVLLEPGLGGSPADAESTDHPERRDEERNSASPPGNGGQQPLGGAWRIEYDGIISALDSARGPHFWLVTAPPGLGKTALVSQLSEELTRGANGWRANRIDLREQSPKTRADIGALLALLFQLKPQQVSDDAAGYRAIAKELARQGRPFLCVLDSAEGLSGDTSKRLRSALSEIYQRVEGTASRRARLALIVASRLDDDWLGVIPAPPLAVLSVAECGTEFIEGRLRALAARSEREYSTAELTRMATLVHEVTAGLPALLDPVLKWIEDEEWLELKRLRDHDVFELLAGRYIDDSLLAPDSIFPRDAEASQERQKAVRAAIRYLVRYRFFTWSHVRQYIKRDDAFRRLLINANWQDADLWAALSGMALLKRPLDEPWQEFQWAIRRLLYRHFYVSAEESARAHAEAADFIAELTIELRGKEQVVSFVEGLWHTASALRLRGSGDIAEQLRNFVRTGAGMLRKSYAYSAIDLPSYAAQRIRGDAELQDTIGDLNGLADELINIVMTGE